MPTETMKSKIVLLGDGGVGENRERRLAWLGSAD